MKLIAMSGENNKIYEIKDNWYHVWKDAQEENKLYIPKKDNPAYPLAACLKWGFTPVDVEYLNKLSAELKKK